jgi:hypothetical protein
VTEGDEVHPMFKLENLKYLCIDGKIVRVGLKGIGCESVGWIQLAQDKAQCQALVNTVLNLYIP